MWERREDFFYLSLRVFTPYIGSLVLSHIKYIAVVIHTIHG